MLTMNRFLVVCPLGAAACSDGGSSRDEADDEVANQQASVAAAGSSSPPPRAARWTGTQFCTGNADGEPLKTSEETELAAYEKSRTRVNFLGLNVGPSKDYSCEGLDLEALVAMSDKSGAFFEGGDAVACTSETGKRLTAQVGIGHDTDLRWIEPSDAPTLSFDVALREVEDASDGGLATHLPAFLRCSFDLKLR
jgi:hypothetical protein